MTSLFKIELTIILQTTEYYTNPNQIIQLQLKANQKTKMIKHKYKKVLPKTNKTLKTINKKRKKFKRNNHKFPNLRLLRFQKNWVNL